MTYAYGQEDDLGIGSAHTDEIESLRQQLAECQAREKALREAIQYIAEWGAADASDASDDNYSYAENILKSVPFDSTALDTMLKQAKREALLEAANIVDINNMPLKSRELRRMAEELK